MERSPGALSPVAPWPALLDAARREEGLAPVAARLVAAARAAAALPPVRRVYRFPDVGRHRTWLDRRSLPLEEEIQEAFALAMSDFGAAGIVARELPLLAAAFRLTGEETFRQRVVDQLTEMATWSPLQRPGWTLYARGHRLPPDGKDGNWLATGMGVRGLADTLDLLPAGTLAASLRESLQGLLRREVAGVVDDWETRRSWFVRADNPVTNQWVLPTEGLIRACLALGAEGHREAYELGVRNLLRALDAHGPAGEFEEGIGYAAFTVASLLHAAHAMAVAGDRRGLDHPFLQNFPRWAVHHIQPGRMAINCFDAGAAALPRDSESFRNLLSLCASCTGSLVALWALREQFDGPSEDLAGLACQARLATAAGTAPPLFAHYLRAARVNWRDSWADDATGVWIRGGHELDQHDHQDRGHVNFIARGRPLLIEAGTPAYDNPAISTLYSSGAGHNVLQIGTRMPEPLLQPGRFEPPDLPGWQPPGLLAPLAVRRLDGAGGDVTVDLSRGYAGLARWQRQVRWDSSHLQVDDDVVLEAGRSEVVLLRWHLGAEAGVSIDGQGNRFAVSWPQGRLELIGSGPLAVEAVPFPDNTLSGIRSHTGDAGPTHVCAVVRSREPVDRLRLTARAAPAG
jgi:hypothetical protein